LLKLINPVLNQNDDLACFFSRFVNFLKCSLVKESPSLDYFKKVVSEILGSVNQHFKDLRFCFLFFSHLLISSSSLNCDKRVFDERIGNELVLAQSECLVKGAVNKILI
jgi:hypothetical protein